MSDSDGVVEDDAVGVVDDLCFVPSSTGLWMAPPMGAGRSGRSFREWLSHTWAEVVNHPDPEQKASYRLAGTAIDVLSGLRACDPKRLAIYFTQHSSPNTLSDKEYQHIVPQSWRQPGRGPGRFWGVYGLRKATTCVEIAKELPGGSQNHSPLIT